MKINKIFMDLFKQNMTMRKKFLLFIALPTLLVAFYYAFLASNMYVSEARFSIRGPEGGGGTDILSILVKPEALPLLMPMWSRITFIP